jgi:hypothetical protein
VVGGIASAPGSGEQGGPEQDATCSDAELRRVGRDHERHVVVARHG